MPKLSKSFYTQNDVIAIAKGLLGKVLCTEISGEFTSGIITETEAYCGINDRASHAYGGRRTRRTEVMYAEGGTAYVYFCYGMHSLFNVVTHTKDVPHAVLIRSIKPHEGVDIMLRRCGKSKTDKLMGKGPGRVAKSMGITCDHNGLKLFEKIIWIEDRNFNIDKGKINCGPRIGVDYAGDDAKLPYRFWIDEI